MKRISLTRRAVCVSDIHGHVDLLDRLLGTAGYTDRDTLLILGDIYLKGPRPEETLRRVMELSRAPGVHVLRGNCDDIMDWMTPEEAAWVEGLPHVIDAGDFVFVHGGLPSEDLDGLDAWACMKNDNFLAKCPAFSRWLVVGHYPTFNYCYQIPCHNPILSAEKRVASIDGGCQIKRHGQLNALIIEDGAFSFEVADGLPRIRMTEARAGRGGTLNIVWDHRTVEMVSRGGEFSTVRHMETGTEVEIPTAYIFREQNGRLSGCGFGTDYFLPVAAGETVSVADEFSDRYLAKKNGVAGWVMK
ncbi:MAG: metallophosphoesterase [Oscillospiraceae bacterium]|nr:metallophosphoesterase [Oscillospiraceae bacterium]